MTGTGSSLTAPRRAARYLLACAVLISLAAPPATQGGSRRTKKSQDSYAIVAGTVFRDDGSLLRGADITLRPDPEGGASVKAKALTSVSDSRGEFAFRVPAAPMRYNVGVKAAGFQTQEKQVSISGEERVDVFFQMERAEAGK